MPDLRFDAAPSTERVAMTTLQERVGSIRQTVADRYIDRTQVVDMLVTTILAGHHALLIGPPGTGKSLLARDVFTAFLADGQPHFEYQVNRFTTMDELFGVVDIQEFKAHRFIRHVKGKLPEATTAYIDEFFKASGALHSALLSLMQERIYYQDGVPIESPLRSMVTSSNEIPVGDNGLAAVYDRLLVRMMVKNLNSPGEFEAFLRLSETLKTAENIVGADPLTLEELDVARDEILHIQLDDTAFESLTAMQTLLKEEGIEPSPRRFSQMIELMKAEAWQNKDDTVTYEHIGIAEHVLWIEPDHINTVKEIVLNSTNPSERKAEEYWKAVQDGWSICDRNREQDVQAFLKKARTAERDAGRLRTSSKVEQFQNNISKVIKAADSLQQTFRDDRLKNTLSGKNSSP
jgi:MoxR-like ATPase